MSTDEDELSAGHARWGTGPTMKDERAVKPRPYKLASIALRVELGRIAAEASSSDGW